MFSKKSSKFLTYFVTLITFGTAGFYFIGGDEWSLIDSFYMTIITMTTVGFGEVHPLDDMGRLWTSFVIIFGVSGFLYMIAEFGAELLEFTVYKENKKKRKIRKMKNHYIICGYGRMGAVIAKELHDKGYPLVIVELDQDKVDKITEIGYQSILGDATIEKTLEEVISPTRKKYVKSALDSIQAQRIAKKLESAMQDQQLFLQADLSLPMLAKQLQVPANYLSQTLNENLKESFFDYVNAQGCSQGYVTDGIY